MKHMQYETTAGAHMERAIVYCRKSPDDETRRSVELQRLRGEQYADARGFDVAAVLVDEGVSGAVPIAQRPAGAQLLELLRAGDVRHVIAADTSRLGRDSVDVQAFARTLSKRGGTLHLWEQGGVADVETPEGELSFGVQALVVQHYRSTIRRKTREALCRLREQGVRVGRPPRGYKVVDRRLVPDPNYCERPEIARARDLRQQGMTLREIGKALGVSHVTVGSWVNVQREAQDVA